MNEERRIAYFSMEIGLEPAMPTYSGGLGVLAGDTLRSAADLEVPLVGVTLLHRKGYFHQKLDPEGWQSEESVKWAVDDYLEEMKERTSVSIEGRAVHLRPWRYELTGTGGYQVPVYFLDADLPENSEWDRTLTDYLYGGDQHYRLCQEVILGIGGMRMLDALGYESIGRFHMNEGHSSFLTLELLDRQAAGAGRESIIPEDLEAVRRKCVFTTHTPVSAGHDRFPMEMVKRVLGSHKALALDMQKVICCDGLLNMTYLALNLSHYVNGVGKRHGEISRHMFAPYMVEAITNGVHAPTWTSKAFQDLFDRHIPGWREDSFSLRYALGIPEGEIWAAHMEAKRELIQYVNRLTNVGMDIDILTLGFARRVTAYKRPVLLLEDIERLRAISASSGPFQVVYAGKAHPQDQGAKELIKLIYQTIESLKKDIKMAFLPNYDMQIGKLITAGVDVWLNTPQPPFEASGTSGMKAALNGVPSLSILDGWWIEGCIEGITGWAIGGDAGAGAAGDDRSKDAASLYDRLEKVVIPMFYRHRDRFLTIMRHCIALNGSFFNTQRMMLQYVLEAYF